jgi:predicted PurR-regulated permease PerM
LVAGGALWVNSGMFLSILLIAIVKAICDHVDPLQPVGFLLGDSMTEHPILTILQPKNL